jgi:hypothetical protein
MIKLLIRIAAILSMLCFLVFFPGPLSAQRRHMLRYVTFTFVLSICCLTGGSPHLAFAQDAFKNKLRDLDRMRTEKPRDVPIDYDAVEKRGKELQDLKKKNQEQLAARQEAQYSRKLWIEHQALFNDVVELYSRSPYADTEIREMATKILNKPEQVDALMKRVEANGALKDDPLPQKGNAATQNK